MFWTVKELLNVTNGTFKNVKHPDIVFDYLVLPESSSHKHLGLIITNNLSWTSHINSIVNSVSPIVDVMKEFNFAQVVSGPL